MQQKYFNPKTGQEREAPKGAPKDQPKYDGQKPAQAAPAPEKKQRRERADSIVQRILSEVAKMAGPKPASPEAKAADSEKKNIKKRGGDILNKNRKSDEEKADSYDAKAVAPSRNMTLQPTPAVQPPPMPMPPSPMPANAPPDAKRLTMQPPMPRTR